MVNIDLKFKTDNSIFDVIKKKVEEIKQSASNIKDDFSKKFDTSKIKKGFEELKEKMTDNIKSIPVVGEHLAKLTTGLSLTSFAITGLAGGAFLLGKHMLEVTEQIEGVKKSFRGIEEGKNLDLLTAKTIGLKSVFKDLSENELASAVNVLKNEFGVESVDAIELLKKSLVATNGSLDLDNVKEYATQFKQAGTSAEEFLTVLTKSNQLGLYQDKGADTIKEFGLRFRENTKAVQDAFKFVGIDGDKLLKNLNSGKINEFQAFKTVFKDIDKLNKTQQQTLISGLTGGTGEDLGINGLKQIANISGDLDDLVKAQGKYTEGQLKIISLNEELTSKQQEYTSKIAPFLSKLEILWLKIRIGFESAYVTIFKVFGGIYRLFESLGIFIKNVLKFLLPTNYLSEMKQGFASFFSFVGGKFTQFISLTKTLINILNDSLRGNFGSAAKNLKLAIAQSKDLFSSKLPSSESSKDKTLGLLNTDENKKVNQDLQNKNLENISNQVSGVTTNVKHIHFSLEALQKIDTQNIYEKSDAHEIKREVNKLFAEVANDINNF